MDARAAMCRKPGAERSGLQEWGVRDANIKLLGLIVNLGYGSRKEVTRMFREGRITDKDGYVLYADDKVPHARVRLDGQLLDPAPGLVLMMHKPLGVSCSHKEQGRLVYELLPPRYRRRRPLLSTVGRLDRDTSGLLLFTDDGVLLHRIISPKAKVAKCYEATLAEDLRGHEVDLFASGSFMLASEITPLAPARLDVLTPRRVQLTVTEGRYHQVRRMFAATGNRVVSLCRVSLGALVLGDLLPGAWRPLLLAECAQIFTRRG